MQLKHFCRLSVAGLLVSAGLATAASATSVQVSITNNQDVDGVYITPLLSIFHDGTFDTFDRNNAASASVELLAEQGDPSGVAADAAAAGATTGVILAPGGFAGAPVLDPGETASIQLSVDPMANRYLSYLAMVIPSNDTFIGNDDSMAYEVFDAAGAFTNLGPIQIYSNQAWDAGTEENDGLGAPFNTAGGTSTDTIGVVRGATGNLFFLNGQETVAGTTIDLSGRTLLATINVSEVPLPAGFPLLIGGLAAFGLLKRRKT